MRIDIDVSQRIAKDCACRTACQTFRVRTVHANLRYERVLKTLLADRDRSLDLNSTPQQTRLPVNLVTGQRTVATPDAQVHVHHENICAIDDSRRDLLFRRLERVQIRNRFDGERQRAAGASKSRERLDQLLAEIRIRREEIEWHFEHFGSRHHARSVFPRVWLRDALETETISPTEKIDPRSFVH